MSLLAPLKPADLRTRLEPLANIKDYKGNDDETRNKDNSLPLVDVNGGIKIVDEPTKITPDTSLANEKLGHAHENDDHDSGNVEEPPEPETRSKTSTEQVSGVKDDENKTPYERLSIELTTDQKYLKEITLGKRIGFYRIRGELGSGNFSQVKLGVHTLTKEKVAIKILDKTKLDSKTQRLLSREISSMETLQHPNIIRLYEVVETLAKLYLVMEYCSGGELFTRITSTGKLQENEARPIFAQVVAAIDHMHNSNIIHRDLKAENVFLVNNEIVKVGDFGFSIYSSPESLLNTFCGSPPYAAPELFRDDSYVGIYVDIWALGIMLYFLVTGVIPFRADTVAKLKRCIIDGSYVIPQYISSDLKNLIMLILKPVPSERLLLSSIRDSSWLSGSMFPEPLVAFNRNPTDQHETPTEAERETHKRLLNLGIDEEHYSRAHGKDSRSSITGIYRIILHRCQKRNEIDQYEDETDNKSPWQRQNSTNRNASPVATNNNAQFSKFCTLL